MENNGREQWDPTFLLQWENLYAYLGIFHGLIAKKPIPGRSELSSLTQATREARAGQTTCTLSHLQLTIRS